MMARARMTMMASALFGCFCVAGSASAQLEFRVGTMDDVNHYIPGTLVEVEPVGGNAMALLSDAEGLTAFRSIAPSSFAFVTLAETQYAGGVSLGQKYLAEMPSVPASVDSYSYTRFYHQPRALPTYIQTVGTQTAAPFHTRWRFVPFIGAAKMGFQAQVAILLTPAEIAAYQAFYGVQFPTQSNGYALALVIRTSSAVNIGTDNLSVEINCQGHGFQGAPGVSNVLVRTLGSPPFATPYTFHASVSFWEDTPEVAHIVLTGKLEKGDNIILLYSGSGLTSGLQYDSSAPSLTGTIEAVQDCDPVPPLPPTPWTCLPEIPSSNCPVTLGVTLCGTKTIPVCAFKCGSSGETHSSGWRSHWGGSISVSGNVGGAPVALTGSYSWEITGDTDYNYGPGAGGCGECKRDFQHFLSCISRDTLWKSTWRPRRVGIEIGWQETLCDESYQEDSECNDSGGPSTTVCNRICN